MNFHGLLLLILFTFASIMGLALVYVRVQAQSITRARARRRDELAEISLVKSLTDNQRLTLFGYVFSSATRAQKKKVLFETLRTVLLTVSGLAPIMAILTSNGDAQKLLNAITSISALFLAVLGIERFAVEHRRSGYLIEGLLQSWVSGSGKFSDPDDSPVKRFRLLVDATKEILDNAETSFVTQGQQNKGSQGRIASPEMSLEEVGEIFDRPEPKLAEPSIVQPGLPPFAPGTTRNGGAIAPPESIESPVQVRSKPISPEEFPSWQAEQLALQSGSDDEPEITQAGI